MTNQGKQRLGLFAPRLGIYQDVPGQPLSPAWHFTGPDLDYASLCDLCCRRVDLEYEFPRASVWYPVWIFAYESPLRFHSTQLTRAYTVGLGYLKVFVPPEKILRWIEGKLNLLGRLPHYVAVDQKTHGRYGVLPTSSTEPAVAMSSYLGSSQRLGP